MSAVRTALYRDVIRQMLEEATAAVAALELRAQEIDAWTDRLEADWPGAEGVAPRRRQLAETVRAEADIARTRMEALKAAEECIRW